MKTHKNNIKKSTKLDYDDLFSNPPAFFTLFQHTTWHKASRADGDHQVQGLADREIPGDLPVAWRQFGRWIGPALNNGQNNKRDVLLADFFGLQDHKQLL